MTRHPLIDLSAELDLHLELDSELTLLMPAEALAVAGLRIGQTLAVDLHPLSLRLEPVAQETMAEANPRTLAQVAPDGRIKLPVGPPLLRSSKVILQVRHRGLIPELHLLADGE